MAKRTSDVTESSAVEAPDLESAAADAPKHGFFVRLYTGTGAFEVIGRRKMWYTISGLIVAVCIASMVLRGFTFGIDFEGGTKVSMPAEGVSTERVEEVFSQALGKDTESVVVVGNGPSATVQIRSEALNNDEATKLRDALFDAFQPKGSMASPASRRSAIRRYRRPGAARSPTRRCWPLWSSWCWRPSISPCATSAIWPYPQWRHWFSTWSSRRACTRWSASRSRPATVIGLLTILGFSLYDTVIVFDKVEENTHGFQHTTRRTFAEQANLAINQTFMRSINTSLISVLPIISLMVVAVWLLGVGTLKDLALVQLVGVIVGTYSSIFFATPLLVTLRERTELVGTHTRRVLNRRKPTGEKSRPAETAAAEVDTDADKEPVGAASAAATASKHAVADKPAPGARPIRPTTSKTGRPAGKRNTRRR